MMVLVLSEFPNTSKFLVILLSYRTWHSLFSVMIFFLPALRSRDVNQYTTDLSGIKPWYRFGWYLVKCVPASIKQVPAQTKVNVCALFSLILGRVEGYMCILEVFEKLSELPCCLVECPPCVPFTICSLCFH